MQTAVSHRTSQGAAASARCSRSGALLRPVAFTTRRASRSLNVQVFAKGKGRSGRYGAGVPGQVEMVQRAPPTPEVDPENAEFVIFIRAKNYMEGKVEIKQSKWVPLSIVKGGQAANFLVKALETEWGRKLYAKTLIKNIGQAVYKDRENIERGVKSSYPPFKTVPSASFEYAFKIRDKSVPKDWYKDVDITVLPPPAALEGTAADALKQFFSSENLSKLFSA